MGERNGIVKRFIQALESLAHHRDWKFNELTATLQGAINSVPEVLRWQHENIGIATLGTFGKMRQRMSILEAATIYEGMSATRADEIVRAMGPRPSWRIVYEHGKVYLGELEHCRFSADQLEALALMLRAAEAACAEVAT